MWSFIVQLSFLVAKQQYQSTEGEGIVTVKEYNKVQILKYVQFIHFLQPSSMQKLKLFEQISYDALLFTRCCRSFMFCERSEKYRKNSREYASWR